MRHVSHVSMLSIRNVFLATTLLGSMALAVSAAPPGNPPGNPPANPPANPPTTPPANNPDLGGPPVGAGASDSEKGFDGGKQGGKKAGGQAAGGRIAEERSKGMVWMKTFDEMKPTLNADVQAKADAIKAQFDSEMKTWRETNGEKQKALVEQMKATKGQKPDPALMDQMKALRETMPKMEDSQKQIFALMSESEQTAFKTKLDSNEKQMKSKRGVDEMGAGGKGDGKGKSGKGGAGKGNSGGKPGDGAPPEGGSSDKTPPPPPFDP